MLYVGPTYHHCRQMIWYAIIIKGFFFGNKRKDYNKGVWTATKEGRITIYNYLRDVHVIVSQLTWIPSTHEPMAGGFQFPPFSLVYFSIISLHCESLFYYISMTFTKENVWNHCMWLFKKDINYMISYSSIYIIIICSLFAIPSFWN